MKEESYYRFKANFDRLDKAEAKGKAFLKDVEKTLAQSALALFPLFKEHKESRDNYLEPILKEYTREVFDCFDYAYSSNSNDSSQSDGDSSRLDEKFYKKELILRQELKKVLVKYYEEDLINFDGPCLRKLDSFLFTKCIYFYDAIASLFSRHGAKMYHLKK